MHHLKGILFLILCLAVGVGMGRTYLWFTDKSPAKRGFEHHEAPPPVTGTGDAPGSRGFTLAALDIKGLPTLLKQWENAYATTVGIQYAPGITRQTLVRTAEIARAHHMQVVLLPPPVTSAQNPFPRPLAEVAADAQAAHIDFLCISWLDRDPDPAYWRPEIAAARQAFRGRLILAAVPHILPDVSLWESVDLVGAIGPIPIPRRLPDAPDDITVHDVRVAWDCVLTQWESLARLKKIKLALLHMNIPSAVTMKLPLPLPPGVPEPVPSANPDLQKKIYEALLLETKGRAATTEILLFDWGTSPGERAAPNLSGIMETVTEAWDPKKPRINIAEPEPDDMGVDDPAIMEEDKGVGATPGTGK